ncbi:MAG TPA: glycosyltransferase family 39 protein [Candidatus Bathyarchaeia archaeon]|nr:glycosyltransferase family 39 protein [Candidatus Bathyarchaeia archaeon]
MISNKFFFSKISLLAIAIICCSVSIFIYASDNKLVFYRLTFFLWIASLLLIFFFVVFSSHRQSISYKKSPKEVLFLFILILFSGFIRFYRLTEIPLLSGDEVRDAGFLPEAFLRGEIKDLFGHGIYGIPNLFFALASIPHLLFGHSVLSIRFFAAFFGVLAVVLTYFLGKELFNSQVGKIASILMVTYHVHVHFSRSEFINNLDSFWAPLVAILLLKTFSNPSASLIFGLFLGLGFHLYQGIRAFLIYSFIYFIFWTVNNCYRNTRRFLVRFGYLLSGIILGLGPSVVVILKRPKEFFNTGTAGGLLPFQIGIQDFLSVFPERLLNSFGALIRYPIDFHYRYGGPFLEAPLNLFFLVGFLVCFQKLSKKEYNFIIFWLFFVILINSTFLRGMNFTHRLLSLVPAIMLTVSLGIIRFATFFNKQPRLYRVFLVLVMVISLFYNLKRYFYDLVWRNAYDSNTKVSTTAGFFTAELPAQTKIFFLNSPRMSWESCPSWKYLAPHAYIEDLTEENFTSVLASLSPDSRLVFIALPERINDLEKIEKLWPLGIKKKKSYGGELLFVSYKLN